MATLNEPVVRLSVQSSKVTPGPFPREWVDLAWEALDKAPTLVWVKDSLVLGHADYHFRHEPILYGYKAGGGRRGRGGDG